MEKRGVADVHGGLRRADDDPDTEAETAPSHT